MGVIIRQSIQNSIISYLGVALGFVSTILLYPRFLTTDQFGLTRLLLHIAMVCAQFAHLGVKNMIIRFFPYFRESPKERARFLSLSMLVSLAGFLLFTIGFLLLQDRFLMYYKDQSALFAEYHILLIPLVLGILFFEVLNNYIRALQDAVTGSLVHEVLLRSLIIVLLVIYRYNFIPFGTFMIGFIASYCIQPLVLLGYLYRQGELKLTYPKLDKRSKFIKGMGVYGAYSLLGGLATLLVGNIDIIMLGAMTNLDSTAIYAIAFYVASVIAIPQTAILKIATPVLAGLLKEKNYAQISSLYQRTSMNQIIAGTLLFIGIWANMHNLMNLLPAAYRGARWLIIVIGLAKLFDMATGINGGIILNSKYYRFDLYTTLFLVVLAITTNYLLIPVYGMMGAALATMISIVIYNSIKLIFVGLKFSMQPFRWNAPVILLIGAGCLLLSFQIPYLYNFGVDLIVRSTIITVIFIGSILLFNLSDDVKHLAIESKARLQQLLKS